MGSAKAGKPSKKSLKNPNHLRNAQGKVKKKKRQHIAIDTVPAASEIETQAHIQDEEVLLPSASQQLSFFLTKFQSANGLQDTCFMELFRELPQDVEGLGKRLNVAFGKSWKDELCDQKLVAGKIEPGSPAVLFISTSALRAIELLRGVRSLTKQCHAAKLFSKHMKVEEQVSFLKNRVNIASGTPNRLKKLIDIKAMGLSRLKLIVLDVHHDVKGYSLLTLPQVRDEFWDLYMTHIHQKVLQGELRLCLFGPIREKAKAKAM
ncbi:Protein CMS1 [Linum perenne]